MKILKEMETGYGTGKWILADMGDEFYGYGTPTDFKSIYGLPVNQCGSRAEVIESLSSRASCCKKTLSKYQREFKKSFSEGWKQLMLIEEKELEMLLTFARTLRGNETEAASVCESLTIKLNGRMHKICIPTDESQLNELLGIREAFLLQIGKDRILFWMTTWIFKKLTRTFGKSMLRGWKKEK